MRASSLEYAHGHHRRRPLRRPPARDFGLGRGLGAGATPSFSGISGAGTGGPAAGSGAWGEVGADSGVAGAGSGGSTAGAARRDPFFAGTLRELGETRGSPSVPSARPRRPTCGRASGSVCASRLVSVEV